MREYESIFTTCDLLKLTQAEYSDRWASVTVPDGGLF